MEDTETIVPATSAADSAESQQVDYFGVDAQEKVFLPDGVSYVIVKELDEGARRQYLNKTNKDIRLERQTGDAHLRMATGDERYYLLKAAICGWNLVRTNPRTGEVSPINFSGSALDQFLETTRPKLLDPIEAKVREMNPWLLPAEITVEVIDEQIEELKRQREKLEEREAGKDA